MTETLKGWLSVALLTVMIGGPLIYIFFFIGDPEVKKFREDCWRRAERKYYPGDMPDYARMPMIQACEGELREFLDQRRARSTK